MYREDTNDLIKRMQSITRVQRNSQGHEVGVVFKNCPYCMANEVSAISYATGLFYCKACSVHRDTGEMRKDFVKVPKKNRETDWRKMYTVKCRKCKDIGVVFHTYPNGMEYVTPCDCAASSRYDGLRTAVSPYTPREAAWNRDYTNGKIEILADK